MNINSTANELLLQLEEVVGQLNQKEFTTPSIQLSHATVGQHLRHTLEFFICLIDASNSGKLNYDKRRHDNYIQEDKNLALSVIKTIRDFVNRNNENFDLEFEVDYSITDDAEVLNMTSNFYRELAYNIEHAVHHMALIKIGIKEINPAFHLAENFGVASSTIRYQRNLEKY